MKRIGLRNILIAAVLIGATALGTTLVVNAQQGGYGPGYGMGPGMMGPGMMGGYGPGPGGGYGPGYGMGPGMMGGGMMSPGMMGPGMMGGRMGYGMLNQLDLSPDQWNKINAIHENLARKNWELAGKTQEEAFRLRNLMSAEKRDRHAITNQYKKVQEARMQSFQAQLDAQERTEGVLTKEQKEQLRRFAPWWGQHME